MEQGIADQVGAVVVKDQSVKLVAAGPTILHVFSMDRGGNVFTAAAAIGTDADCVHAQADTRDRQNEIRVDQRRILQVPAGQVACIATASPHSYELLWRARDDDAAPRDLGRPEAIVATAPPVTPTGNSSMEISTPLDTLASRPTTCTATPNNLSNRRVCRDL